LRYDLIAFDVDGTLVRHPRDWTVWEVLNDRFTGKPEVNRERYARYKRGELSYADWVSLDVSGWREAGADRAAIVEAFAALSPVADALETLHALKAQAKTLVVISGTLDLLLHTLLPDAPFDEIYCNHLGFDDEHRIAHWRATPFDMRGKATLLETLAMRHRIPLERCAYVGDSDNDRWIFEIAGKAIAFNPKTDAIREVADAVVEDDRLAAIVPHLHH